MSAESLLRLLEAIPLPVYVKTLAGRMVYMNAASRAVMEEWGVRPGTLMPSVYPTLGTPELAEEIGKADEIAREGNVASLEMTLESPDPERRRTWLSHRVLLRGTDWGDVIVGVSKDVTEQRKVERALRLSEKELRLIWEQSSDGMRLIDEQGGIAMVNEAFCRMVGRPRAALVGQPMWCIYPEHVHAQAREYLRVIFENPPESPEMHFFTRMDGEEVWMEVSYSVLDVPGAGKRVLSICRDVTERKRAEEELRSAKDAAEAALRVKTDFLANISHELRTPMNAILGLTEFTLQTELTEPQRGMLQSARESAGALLGLLDDLLDFSKFEAGKLELETVAFSLAESLHRVHKALLPRALSKKLEFRLDIDSKLPDRLVGDPHRLRQVLLNLLGNAIKFTARGRVILRAVHESAPRGRTIRFFVMDTGTGIAPDKQAVIFEPFTQADGSTTRHFGGTGLGLAISEKIVARMGGRLMCASEWGYGSTFSFAIPLHPAPEPPAVREAPRLTVLAVEDNDVNLKVTTRLLEQLGHEVTVARSGPEALRAVAARSFDLVLMDLQMPGMDGFEATRRIRESEKQRKSSRPPLPIIALTASLQSDDDCRRSGMTGVLRKPLDKNELSLVLERVRQDAASGGLDRDVALARVGGDEELLREIGQLFLMEYPQLLAQMEQAIRAGDAPRLERVAHSLKGSVSNFGAVHATEAALALEELGRSAQWDQVDSALLALRSRLESLRTQIQTL
ncbi:MAG: PAS domain S-box protein [Bryobacteraceae bacterium]|nr:PAS domain S-box protein [Bryobacteraceae bacterium]